MNRPFSKLRSSRFLGLAALFLMVLAARAAVADTVPDWLRQIAHAPVLHYPDEAEAVVLLDDETLTVKENGDMYVNYRRVVKILRPGGNHYGTFTAFFDRDTKLEYMHAWSIAANGQEFELKEKDATESSPFNFALYEDTRVKVMKVPAVEVGAYVAVEYQQRRRPYAFSEKWYFQEAAPVKTARFSINLPAGWEYQYRFANWTEKKPASGGGNTWSWEISDVPGIEREREMPAIDSIVGMMVVSFYSASLGRDGRTDTWSDVARWADSLNASRRVATPKMQETIAQLTAGKTDTMAKVRTLAGFVQHQIRYVAIEIGIGGFQAHMAGDTLSNRYGDCKDKATLLVTMLHEIGIESYLVLVDSHRGVVNPALPTPWTFNHAIVAIKVPNDVDPSPLYAMVDDPKLGQILFFDPTSEMTPFGMLPGGEQNSYGLVVTGASGELVKMPMLPPALNRLLRVAHLQLTPEGSLSGEVEEIRSGHEASVLRGELLSSDQNKRRQYFEEFLQEFLDRSKLTYASITGLDAYDEPLILRYKFVAPEYAKSAGDLMLVRTRVLGNKASDIAEDNKRKYPVSYATTSLQSDVIDIKLPPGYKVDELPAPADVKAPFAEYKSKVEAKDDVLYYNRSYEVKDLLVPMNEFGELRTFMRGVASDERNTAVLKKAP